MKEEKKEITLEQRIEALKNQQEQLKEGYIKVQGAIEVLQSMLEEQKEE
tara:strand:+ start:621 stop:767 length:147 start_codon:yes stop_codon:yes gene_type:complete